MLLIDVNNYAQATITTIKKLCFFFFKYIDSACEYLCDSHPYPKCEH